MWFYKQKEPKSHSIHKKKYLSLLQKQKIVWFNCNLKRRRLARREKKAQKILVKSFVICTLNDCLVNYSCKNMLGNDLKVFWIRELKVRSKKQMKGHESMLIKQTKRQLASFEFIKNCWKWQFNFLMEWLLFVRFFWLPLLLKLFKNSILSNGKIYERLIVVSIVVNNMLLSEYLIMMISLRLWCFNRVKSGISSHIKNGNLSCEISD